MKAPPFFRCKDAAFSGETVSTITPKYAPPEVTFAASEAGTIPARPSASAAQITTFEVLWIAILLPRSTATAGYQSAQWWCELAGWARPRLDFLPQTSTSAHIFHLPS